MTLDEARASGLPISIGGAIGEVPLRVAAQVEPSATDDLDPEERAERAVAAKAVPPAIAPAAPPPAEEPEVTEEELLSLAERIARLEKLLKKTVTVAKLNKRLEALEAWLAQNT